MNPRRRFAAIALWWLVLALAAFGVQRTLVGRKPQLRTRAARTLKRLDEVLNDLDAALKERSASPKIAPRTAKAAR